MIRKVLSFYLNMITVASIDTPEGVSPTNIHNQPE